MEEKIKKRNVAFEKKISELSAEDIRVKVVGKVIEKDSSNDSIVIEHNGNQLRVLLNNKLFQDIEVGKIIRVMGIIAPPLEGETVELRGELVQDFSGLDLSLYEKYLKLKNVV